MAKLLITLMNDRKYESNEMWFGCQYVLININGDNKEAEKLNVSDLKSVEIIGD